MTEDLSWGSADESDARVETAEGDGVTGAEGAETLVGQAGGIAVAAPPPGVEIPIIVQAGQRYVIDFDPSVARVEVVGDDLVLIFANDGRIVFQGLGAIDPLLPAPIFEIAGTDVPAAVLYQQAVALSETTVASEAPPTLETAAGDAGGAGGQGGGATQYSDDTGQTIALLNKQGVIPGTELQFGLIELESLTPEEAQQQQAEILPPDARDDVDVVGENCRQDEGNEEGIGLFSSHFTTGNVLTGLDPDAAPNDGAQVADSAGSNPPIGIVSVSSDLETKTTADAVGDVVTLNTSLGGFLEINLVTGAYTYIPPFGSFDHSAGNPSDLFSYTIQDAAGLTDSATLTIVIADSAPVANPDTDMVV